MNRLGTFVAARLRRMADLWERRPGPMLAATFAGQLVAVIVRQHFEQRRREAEIRRATEKFKAQPKEG